MVSLFYQIQAANFNNALNAIFKKMTMTTMMRWTGGLWSPVIPIWASWHWRLCSVHIGCGVCTLVVVQCILCTLVASDCQRVTLPTTGPCNSALSQVPRPTCWCIVGQGMTLQLTVTYTAPHAYLAAVTIVVNTLCVRLWMANLPTWSDLNKWLLTPPTTSDYTWSNHGMFTAGVIDLVGPNIDRVPAWLVDLKK